MSALLRTSSEISGLSGSSRRFVLTGFALVGGVVIAATTFAVLETRGLEQNARDTIDDTLNSIRVLGRLENQVEKRQTLLHQHVLATESVERAVSGGAPRARRYGLTAPPAPRAPRPSFPPSPRPSRADARAC